MSCRVVACALVSVLATACRASEEPPRPSPAPSTAAAPAAPEAAPVAPEAVAPALPLARDVDRLCNAEARSGALDLPPGSSRQMAVAVWLGENLESDEGRQLLVDIQPLAGAAKAEALRLAAASAGIDGCPLADAWAPAPAL